MKKKYINPVFIISVCIFFLVALCGLLLPSSFSTALTRAFYFVTDRFSWLYILSFSLFVGFCIWIAFFSKYRNLKLGATDEKPEYSNAEWLAMLFSAGTGIGIVFWSVAEPLTFFTDPLGAAPFSAAAQEFTFGKVFFHWCIHPWANYAVSALAIAYAQHRCGRPALSSSLLVPLYGEAGARGVWGKVINMVALFSAAGGVCSTMGLGVMQIDAGVNHLLHFKQTPSLTTLTMLILTVLFLTTCLAGVKRGSAIVSKINMILIVFAMVFFFFAGPTVQILKNLTESIGVYASTIVRNSFALGAYENADWYGKWTIYYCAWGLSWAPFTGAFIARISKGRTIRELVAGTLLFPSITGALWFSIFGTLGISLPRETILTAIGNKATALFVVFEQYPLGKVLSFMMLILVCTLFCTSASSATTALGSYCEAGTPNPSRRTKLIWGILLAMLTLSFVLSSDNGVDMLKIVSVIVGFPFAIVQILSLVSLTKALGKEKV